MLHTLLFEFDRGTPISPNWRLLSFRILRIFGSSYLSEFQNEGGSNYSEFCTFNIIYVGISDIFLMKKYNRFLVLKELKNPFTLFLGRYFIYLEVKIYFIDKKTDYKLTKWAKYDQISSKASTLRCFNVSI